MIEKFIAPGDKLELRSAVRVTLPDGTDGVRTYKTSVYNILDDGKLELMMPMEQTKLILLSIGSEYDVCFYSHKGVYRADVRVVDRQKNNGMYTLVVEMISSLHKYQRREYYRFNCIVDMMVREMTKQEEDAFSRGVTYIISEQDMIKGVIVDISGGGTRFVSRQKFDEGSMLLMQFELPVMGRQKPFLLAAKVIYSGGIENREGEYENRVKFEYIDTMTREEIIRYIFDEERKNRKNGKDC